MNTNNPFAGPAAFLAVIGLSILSHGCGSSNESTLSTTTWTQSSQSTADSPAGQIVDSLKSENRRIRQQMDAMALENKTLVSRISGLERRLTEALLSKAPPPPADLNAAYETALSQYQQKNFSAAARQFESILASSKGFELADNCHYWTGECYYALHQYKDAIDHFQAVFDYVHAKKKADAQFMIGNCQLALGNKVGAITAFARVVNNHPTSDLVKRAEEKLGRIK